MSYEAIPTRTKLGEDAEPDLHPTDLDALAPFEAQLPCGYKGGIWGGHGIARLLRLLADVDFYPKDQFLTPETLEKGANRLAALLPYLNADTRGLVATFISYFRLLSHRGIGLYTSY